MIEENSQPLHVLFFFLLLWLDHFMCNLFWGLIYTTKLKDCCWRCMIWAHYQSHWTSYSVQSFTPPLLSVVIHLSNETKTLSSEDLLISWWNQLVVMLLWVILTTVKHHRQIFSDSDNKIGQKKCKTCFSCSVNYLYMCKQGFAGAQKQNFTVNMRVNE